MLPFETKRDGAMEAALSQVAAVAETAAQRAVLGLDGHIHAAVRHDEREALQQAQAALRQQLRGFGRSVGAALRSGALDDRSAPVSPTKDWRDLSLVDDREVEARIRVDRIARQIAERSESQLRDLSAYMGALLGSGQPDAGHHPLQPAHIAAALCAACEPVCADVGIRQIVIGEVATYVAQLMPACYDAVIAQFHERGIEPLPLVWRAVVPSAGHVGGPTTRSARLDARTVQGGADTGSAFQTGSAFHSTQAAQSVQSAAPLRSRWSRVDGGGAQTSDAEWLALLRRLTEMAASNPTATHHGAVQSRHGDPAGGPWQDSGDLPSLMALNLIKAHRDELQQASPGKLDHMVIDVVGSLFDQILSDPRVQPQMARQIARLQLPVLRVALVDASFFSSRRHPVRRFINRIASLACPFDDFEHGPGLAFLDQVRQLVQDIVDGDFDQPELYIAKLEALERFVVAQVQADPQAQQAATLFEAKESELRVQQRYMAQLQAALAPIALDDYLRTFLAQVWSQALVATTRRDGAASASAQRLRQVAAELAMSVQPKGSPTLRKKFLMQLPALMKDLNSGMQLIGWPDAAQKAFYGHLLPAHAESLKGRPMSELEHNLLAKQLEAIFNAPIPLAESETPTRLDALPSNPAMPEEPHLSPAEARQVGLLRETAVDWSRSVDIDLRSDAVPLDALPPLPATEPGGWPTAPGADDTDAAWAAQGPPTALDLDLSQMTPGPDAAARGPELIDQLRVGFAYQMHLNDNWQKVRLTHVSTGRAFFVFSHGNRHQQTVSLTARMLHRMCETHRLRAFENAYLIERASSRARQQLAALRGSTRH